MSARRVLAAAAATTMGSTPGTGRTSPASPISPMWPTPAITAGSTWSSAAIMATAIPRSRNSGIQRSERAMRSVRSRAAGDSRASQSPPSEPKLFCGAK